jgi:MFS family permease
MSQHLDDIKDEKHETIEYVEYGAQAQHTEDAAPFVVSPEDDKRVCRKIDRRLLPILVWVYFLQILDKYLLGLTAVWGIQKDAHLHGNQYSSLSSMNAIAQLVWLPFSSYLLVRLPAREYMTALVFGWGCALLGMGFSKSYAALCATRFLLGLFEAACLPLFAMMTSQWYRRQEQPFRVACWYGTNGIATILGSLLSWALGHIHTPAIASWQLIFIVPACLTILTSPVIYWQVASTIESAKWLDEHDKKVAVERVRYNKTGTGSTKFKVPQLWEAMYDPKSWVLVGTSVLLNAGASVTGTFGGLLIKGLGFDNYRTVLLNMPFGGVQFLIILVISYLATRFKFKGPFLAGICLPVIAGAAILYATGRTHADTPVNLAGYYLLGFIFAGNPLIVSWAIANTGGSTKKAVTMVMYNIGSSIGNIAGPYVFQPSDAPYYKHGLRSVLAIFLALFTLVILQMAGLAILNRKNAKARAAVGLSSKIVDRSMMTRAEEEANPDTEAGHDEAVVEDDDMPDLRNIKFVYVL